MTTASTKDRNLLSVIGDEDTVTGILLTGMGHLDSKQKPNFLVVDNKISTQTINATFEEFCKRKDIAIILINQHVANMIRESIENQQLASAFPVILEIPSKEHPYDPEKDSILKRIQKLAGDD